MFILKKHSFFSKFTTIVLNNKNFFFSKIWIKGLLSLNIMYLPIHLNFLFKKNSFYLQTVFSKQFLTPTFSSIKNLILSSMRGFKKYLRIRGLGFKVFLEKKFLKFHLGFSHFNYFKILDTLKIKVAGVKSRTIKIIGLNLNLVNQAGFLIRKFRNPGSYNYKGIYFLRENFFLKEGKKKKFR